ncbi:hypothetical protein CMI37_19000 [Candidatus Pacearchaeota archaeon]|nr:hypothetical protein [Candidatus Pacearchaeota archaeon]
MSTQEAPLPVAPRLACQEAADASVRTLALVRRLFGTRLPGSDEWEGDDPSLIRNLENGSRTKLREGLRAAGFHTLKLEESS